MFREREGKKCLSGVFFVGVSENADGMINYSRLIEAGSSSDMLPFLFNHSALETVKI